MKNYLGGRTGDLEIEGCARPRLVASLTSMSTVSYKSPKWSFIASSDPFDLSDSCLSFIFFWFVLGGFVFVRSLFLTTIGLMLSFVLAMNL